MEILTTAQMRAIEELTSRDGISMQQLMEQAGHAIFQAFIKCEQDKKQKIAILCGAGNNGGDALVVASLLQNRGYNVAVYLVLGVPKSVLARQMLKEYLDHSGRVYNLETCSLAQLKLAFNSDVFIDGVFGTSFSGQLTKCISKLFELINTKHAPVYAIDVPSGMDADTGGATANTLVATHTFSLATLKPAHIMLHARKYLGEISVLDIGIKQSLIDNMIEPVYAFTTQDFYRHIKKRKQDSYKNSHGKLLAYCGSEQMLGAALIASRAAYRAGAGMVYTAIPKNLQTAMFVKLPEAIVVPLTAHYNRQDFNHNYKLLMEKSKEMQAMLIGCGLHTDRYTKQTVKELIKNNDGPMILDATALGIIAEDVRVLKEAKSKQIILTPHYGEMAKLLNKSINYVKENKLIITRAYAEYYQVTVVLKGEQTIVATPDGLVYLHLVGNQGLAKAGSGDGLAGTIAAFVAQGYPLDLAANMGVYLHGRAADVTVQTTGVYAMLITDVIENYQMVLK